MTLLFAGLFFVYNYLMFKSKKYFFVILIILLIVLGYFFFFVKKAENITNFDECISAGYPVMESYPEQCRTRDGKTFTREIGTELEKLDLIRVFSPRPNDVIGSPFTIEGEARGTWFFEASFPIKVLDANENILVQTHAEALSEWMTEDFVGFRVENITFKKPTTKTGWIVLEKDNPSALPENADELRVPVEFDLENIEEPILGPCLVTGCSGQVCSDEEIITTCEFLEEYACYQTAKCERQASGQCDWTMTSELAQCLSGK